MDAAAWVSLGIGVASLVIAAWALVYSRRPTAAARASATAAKDSAAAAEDSAALSLRADRRVGEDHRVTWELRRTSLRVISLVNTGPDTAHEVHLYMTVRRSDRGGESWRPSVSPREQEAVVAVGDSIDHAFYEDGATSIHFPVEVLWEVAWQTDNGAPRLATSDGFIAGQADH